MKTSEKMNIDLRAVVYREEAVWLAHCLELDLVAEGSTPRNAVNDLVDLIEVQLNYALDSGNLNSVFRPAPAEFMHMYVMATSLDAPKAKKPSRPVQKIEVRQLALA